MKILYVTSEANPFAASGGLGDVMGALPSAVSHEGNEVSVILPLYKNINIKFSEQFEHVTDISFSLSWRNTGASIYKYKKESVTYYFVKNHYYFDRANLYGEYDDGERFAFFSLSVVEFMLQQKYIPDILHANDWQTALSIIYLKTKYSQNTMLKKIKTVYTVHNIEYQGKYDKYILGDVFDLENKYIDFIEFNGCINLMKGALSVADYVTTVSPNYAMELTYEYFAFGLSDIIKNIKNKFSGVINGIDYSYFSPSDDNDIYFRYNKETVEVGKFKNKNSLQKELGLQINPNVPLLAMITRLTETKGIDLVIAIIAELLSENIQFVLLGTGEERYEKKFSILSEKHSNIKALIKFDRAMSKKIYAACDIFIMPSKSEPCGLAQMIACSYGAIPIVRSVGGLSDSIRPYGKCEDSNGFSFDNFNAHELLYTVKDAIKVYRDKEKWFKLIQNAINSDFSWKKSAQEYISIYNDLLK
jgi:starch synthase